MVVLIEQQRFMDKDRQLNKTEKGSPYFIETLLLHDTQKNAISPQVNPGCGKSHLYKYGYLFNLEFSFLLCLAEKANVSSLRFWRAWVFS